MAVLDADVLYRSAVTKFLLGAGLSGAFRARWSEAIVEEARRNLADHGRRRSLAGFDDRLALARDPLVTGFEHHEAALERTHVKDRHVLAVAIACGATHLVTGNVRDFSVEEASRHAITIVTPDEFGCLLASRVPNALVREIDRADPHRFHAYWARLSQELPRTTDMLEEAFGADLASAPFEL